MSRFLDGLAGLASPWAYLVVALLPMLEASALVGLVVPGETALLVGGFLAWKGVVSLPLMIAAGAGGAILGDSLGYEIGARFGPRLKAGRFGRMVGEQRWARVESYVQSRGGRAVFLGRFIHGLRALVPGLAGASRVPYRSFLPWNAAGGVVWGAGYVLVGYVAGGSLRQVEKAVGRASVVVVIVVVVVAALVLAGRALARHHDEVVAFGNRLLERPALSRLRSRWERPLAFASRRLRPDTRLGLWLTTALVLLILLGTAFGSVLDAVIERQDLTGPDGAVLTFFSGHRNPAVTRAMVAVTSLGSPVVLAPLVVIGALLAWKARGRGRDALFVLVAYWGASALSALVKLLVGRARPPVAQMATSASGYAFPSGHATETMAAFGGVALVVAGGLSPWGRKVAVWTVALALSLLVGLSRLYLGVHWLTDVLGGWALGATWVAAVVAGRRILDANPSQGTKSTAALAPAGGPGR